MKLLRVAMVVAASGCLMPVQESTPDGSVGDSACVVDTGSRTVTADIFGAPTFFDDGASLAAGTYRLRNNGGCMRYGPGQNWTVNAYASGVVSWWVVGADTSSRLFIPPGTTGFERVPGSVDRDIGSFSSFAACDAANRALPSRDFDHPGGKLGLWLRDEIYGDNSPGENGKNPSWTLSRVTAECP
jgi:hypothetical protein